MRLTPPATRCLLFALAAIVRAGQVAPLQQGSIEGLVTNSLTGEPVGNATLTLMGLRYIRGGNNSQPETHSQADGAFHFDSLAAGSYVITAERSGFVPNELNTRSRLVSITAGEALTGVTVTLTPEGSLSGKIEEEDGTPVPGARIEAIARLTTHGRTSLRLYSNADADGRGRFSLKKLPPNEYYLIAEPPDSLKKADKEGSLVRTIYPRSLDIDGGSTVAVGAGQTVADIELRIRRASVFHIRGKVAEASTETPNAKMTVAVSPKGAVDSPSLTRKIPVNPNRTFDIGGLTPGAYTLRLTGPPRSMGRGQALLAREDVEIGGGNLDGVVLSIMPALAVSGQVRVDSSGNEAMPQVNIVARPLEDLSHATQGFAKVASDGSFTFPTLDPGLYVFRTAVAAAGWYVKAIALNRQDVLNKEIDLSEMSSAHLEIVVSPGAGEVDGSVQTTAGQSGGETAGNTIVLVPEVVGPDGSGVLFAYSGRDGAFALKNIRPGKYLGYATLRGDPNLWQNPDFLQAIASQGASVEVQENGRQQLPLALLTMEQVEQAAGRLGLRAQ